MLCDMCTSEEYVKKSCMKSFVAPGVMVDYFTAVMSLESTWAGLKPATSLNDENKLRMGVKRGELTRPL